MDLISERKLQAYRIADKFLRLKKTEVLSLRNTGDVPNETVEFAYTKNEKFSDFFYFNDFYLVSGAIILGLIFFIFHTG